MPKDQSYADSREWLVSLRFHTPRGTLLSVGPRIKMMFNTFIQHTHKRVVYKDNEYRIRSWGFAVSYIPLNAASPGGRLPSGFRTTSFSRGACRKLLSCSYGSGWF